MYRLIRSFFKLLKKDSATRMIYETDDGCIAQDLFKNQQAMFTKPLDLVAMQGTGHFMQWEKPMEFSEQVLGFLPRLSATASEPT